MSQPCSKMTISFEEFMELASRINPGDAHQRSGSPDVCTNGQGTPWRGGIIAERLRPGVDIFAMNLWVPVDMHVYTEYTEPAVCFGLALEGESFLTVPGTSERLSSLAIKAGQNLAAVCRPEKTHLHFRGGQWHRIVKLRIFADEIPALLNGQDREIPEILHPIMFPSKPWRANVHQPLTPALECIAHQLVNCPFTGAARRLFLEGKALEILAEELGGGSGNASLKKSNHSPEEFDRLERARTILEQEYDDPPTIMALSRRIGLNDFKLKRGFRDLYGTTIFGYVRKLRMEKARALLVSGSYNVTEVAIETGHSSLGHFAAAFKREFGVVPSRYRCGAGKVSS